jgi:hypothetical protein
MAGRGVVTAGHPATAVAGAAVLRAGGNAVDAAVLTSLVAAPLLTGLGAGGYLPMAPPDGGGAAGLLRRVARPRRGRDRSSAAAAGAALLRRRHPAPVVTVVMWPKRARNKVGPAVIRFDLKPRLPSR